MSTEKIELPNMNHEFRLSVRGRETGKLYEGEFIYTRPNLFKKAQIDKMKTRLNGDLKNLPFETQVFHQMVATLYNCLTKCPEWWKDCNYGQDLYDVEVIEEVWREVMTFEDTWNKKVYGPIEDKDIRISE